MKKDQVKVISFFAFAALILSAFVLLALFIAGLLDANFNPQKYQFIAQLTLTVVVVWLGWAYAKGLNKFWRIVFIVVAILAILGALGISFMPQFK